MVEVVMSVDCSLERLNATEWKTLYGKALVGLKKIANDYENFAPGARLFKGAVAVGSLMLDPESSPEYLQKKRENLNSKLEKIALSRQNTKLKAVAAKNSKIKMDKIDKKISNPPEEISTDFLRVNADFEHIRSEFIKENESFEKDIAPIKDVIAKTFSSVSDQGFKVCIQFYSHYLL